MPMRRPRTRRLASATILATAVVLAACQPAPPSQQRSKDAVKVPSTSLPDATRAPDSTPPAAPASPASPTAPAAPASPNGVWSTPVSALSPGDPRWADRLCRFGDAWGSCGDRWTTEMMGPDGNDYSIPVYDASTATTNLAVRRKNSAMWSGFFSVEPNEAVPWNPTDWRPSLGNDGYMVVRDQASGHEWGFWNVSWWNHQTDVNNSLQCDPIAGGATENLPAPVGVGFDPGTMLCAAGAFEVTDPAGAPVDTRTWRGNFPGASGGGWSLGALVVTPDQVASGAIRHALHFYSANTMGGPECAPDQQHMIGETCGGAVAPAGKLEKHAPTPQPLAEQVPEGTRFSIDLSDAEIEAWLGSRGYTGRLKETARTVAVALRDYGWFLGDSSPTSAFWVFDSSPTARAQWQGLGVQGDGKDLLRGLVTPDNLRSWAPPTMTCSDGTRTQWYCWAVDGTYP